MEKKRSNPSSTSSKILTLDQVSAGGVAYRWQEFGPEMVIVSVKPKLRWQLPKGIVDPGETPEVTALREVREEAGVETELLTLIEVVEYWYRGFSYGKKVRFHKFVHFFLVRYQSGDISNHDHEVAEARWVRFEEALGMLAFKGEREVVEKAREMVVARGRETG